MRYWAWWSYAKTTQRKRLHAVASLLRYRQGFARSCQGISGIFSPRLQHTVRFCALGLQLI